MSEKQNNQFDPDTALLRMSMETYFPDLEGNRKHTEDVLDILRLLKIDIDKANILDIGCGGGFLTSDSGIEQLSFRMIDQAIDRERYPPATLLYLHKTGLGTDQLYGLDIAPQDPKEHFYNHTQANLSNYLDREKVAILFSHQQFDVITTRMVHKSADPTWMVTGEKSMHNHEITFARLFFDLIKPNGVYFQAYGSSTRKTGVAGDLDLDASLVYRDREGKYFYFMDIFEFKHFLTIQPNES